MHQGQVDVRNLTPNTTYEFQLWTSNRFGKSETNSIFATTLPSFSEIGKEWLQFIHYPQLVSMLTFAPTQLHMHMNMLENHMLMQPLLNIQWGHFLKNIIDKNHHSYRQSLSKVVYCFRTNIGFGNFCIRRTLGTLYFLLYPCP